MKQEKFIEALKECNIVLNEQQLYQFQKYYHLLVKENEKMNLTAITEEEQVYLKHFYDSLTLIKAVDLTKIENLCDIGTGAGFPGLVLKIVFPTLSVTLVDALNKRVLFLRHVIEELELQDIEAVHARMEEYARKNREKFDVVTARAVAPLKELIELGISSVKVGGNLVFMKGILKEEETNKIENTMKILKLKDMQRIKFHLPMEQSVRTLISFTKISPTPNKYPRPYAQIKNCSL